MFKFTSNGNISERKADKTDFLIKDAAMELASELEGVIESFLPSYLNDADLKDLDTNDKGKLLNLAIKKINIKKISW